MRESATDRRDPVESTLFSGSRFDLSSMGGSSSAFLRKGGHFPRNRASGERAVALLACGSLGEWAIRFQPGRHVVLWTCLHGGRKTRLYGDSTIGVVVVKRGGAMSPPASLKPLLHRRGCRPRRSVLLPHRVGLHLQLIACGTTPATPGHQSRPLTTTHDSGRSRRRCSKLTRPVARRRWTS